MDKSTDNIVNTEPCLRVAADERRLTKSSINHDGSLGRPQQKHRLLWLLVMILIVSVIGGGWYGFYRFTQLENQLKQSVLQLRAMQKKMLDVASKASRTDVSLTQSDNQVQQQIKYLNKDITQHLSLWEKTSKDMRDRLAQQLKQQANKNQHQFDDADKERRLLSEKLQSAVADERVKIEQQEAQLQALQKQQEHQTTVEKTAISNQQALVLLKKRLQKYEEVNQSMEQYRKQVNRQLLVLQKQLQKEG